MIALLLISLIGSIEHDQTESIRPMKVQLIDENGTVNMDTLNDTINALASSAYGASTEGDTDFHCPFFKGKRVMVGVGLVYYMIPI